MGVLCANKTIMNSETTRQLNLLLDLLASAQKGQGFNEMKKILVSVSVLCNAGCSMNFGKHTVQVINNNKTIIKGDRDTGTNLLLIQHKNINKNNVQSKS